MVNNNQSFTIKLEPVSVRRVEQIVDLVCDQLFINETYYGSILIASTEMFDLLLNNKHSETFEIEYNTDYQELTISFYPVHEDLIEKIEQHITIDSLKEGSDETKIYLLKSLVDNLNTTEDEIVHLGFDISALHNKIYQQRVDQINKYFKVDLNLKVSKDNDQL